MYEVLASYNAPFHVPFVATSNTERKCVDQRNTISVAASVIAYYINNITSSLFIARLFLAQPNHNILKQFIARLPRFQKIVRIGEGEDGMLKRCL